MKIPATVPGLGAIEDSIAAGRSINVTLIFSLERHAAVAEAYVRGLERLVEDGGDPTHVASVASFFVSRVDTEADRRLAEVGREDLQGRLAIDNAKLAYQHYLDVFSGTRWESLAAAGAKPQRCLWASTSTKNPAYRDVLYVEELVGPDTVNTMPFETIAAFQDHGEVRETLHGRLDEAQALLDELARAGVDYDDVTDTLEREGVAEVLGLVHVAARGDRRETRSARLTPYQARSARAPSSSSWMQAVRRDGASPVDPRDALDVGESAAGLLDDDLHRGEIPLADADRVDGTVDAPFRDEHVRPEVTESPCVPGALDDRRQLVLECEREHGVLDMGDARNLDRETVRERTRPPLRPPALTQRRRGHDAELDDTVGLESDERRPDRDPRE